jgi:hypothetical protein
MGDHAPPRDETMSDGRGWSEHDDVCAKGHVMVWASASRLVCPVCVTRQIDDLRDELVSLRAALKRARAEALVRLFEIHERRKCSHEAGEFYIALQDHVFERMGPFATGPEAAAALERLAAEDTQVSRNSDVRADTETESGARACEDCNGGGVSYSYQGATCSACNGRGIIDRHPTEEKGETK